MKFLNSVLSNNPICNKFKILNNKELILTHNKKIFKVKEINLVVNKLRKLKLNRKKYSYENIY